MRSVRRLAPIALAVAGLAATAPQALGATPQPVLRAAERSVVATRVDNHPSTGFSFRSDGWVVTAAGRRSPAVVTASGRFGETTVLGEEGGLALVRVPEDLGLVPLRTAKRRSVTSGFVIGSPLGFTGGKVRPVSLDRARAARRGTQPGRLPSGFVGAPVVTPRGELIGAVGKVGRRSWTLTSAAALTRAATKAGEEDEGGGGVPLWGILAVALLVLVAALGSIALVSKRRRAAATAAQQPVTLHPRPAEPLVRRREPAADTLVTGAAEPQPVREPEPQPEPEDEDFEVLVREPQP